MVSLLIQDLCKLILSAYCAHSFRSFRHILFIEIDMFLSSCFICLILGNKNSAKTSSRMVLWQLTEISDWLRRNHADKCIILAVNKCESPRKGQMQALDFWSLG
jgi:hypothetical protein